MRHRTTSKTKRRHGIEPDGRRQSVPYQRAGSRLNPARRGICIAFGHAYKIGGL
jgi:hypothetical protein